MKATIRAALPTVPRTAAILPPHRVRSIVIDASHSTFVPNTFRPSNPPNNAHQTENLKHVPLLRTGVIISTQHLPQNRITQEKLFEEEIGQDRIYRGGKGQGLVKMRPNGQPVHPE